MSMDNLRNDEAESSILGAVFSKPDCTHEIRTKLQVDDFYHSSNRVVYKSMIDLAQKIYMVDKETYKGALDYRDYLDWTSYCDFDEICGIFGSMESYEDRMGFLHDLEFTIGNATNCCEYDGKKVYVISNEKDYIIFVEAANEMKKILLDKF